MKIRNSFLHSAFLRKTAPWALLLLLIAILVTAAAFSAHEPEAVAVDANENSSVYYSSKDTASQENEAEEPMNSRNIKIYTIRIHQDTIAIFEESNPVPLHTIDTPPSRLPAADRLLLETGIRTDSLAEAYRLIEDYE